MKAFDIPKRTNITKYTIFGTKNFRGSTNPIIYFKAMNLYNYDYNETVDTFLYIQ